MTMTLAELEAALLNREFEDNIRIAPHMVVCNAQEFLTKQFADCQRWTKDITKCPAYGRLMLFHQAITEKKENQA